MTEPTNNEIRLQSMLDDEYRRTGELQAQLAALREELTGCERERDIRGELLDQIQAAVGVGWWHGILDALRSDDGDEPDEALTPEQVAQ